jgi:phosphoserine phosphatase RsbU/P
LLKFTLPYPITFPLEPRRPVVDDANKTRILVAEDDAVSRELICSLLEKWGYAVVVAENGTEAMSALRKKDAPSLAILDWSMPGMDGLEICRRVREADRVLYAILLTARNGKDHIIEGLSAGADDYLVKPFDKDELRARILVGLRTMDLQNALLNRLRELGEAAAEIRALKLQIPI